MFRSLLPFAAIVSLMLCIASPAVATTWNEPWMDSVISQSDNLVLGRIISTDPEAGVTLRIIRTVAGTPIEGEVKVNDFYALEICSMSRGHGPEFFFEGIDSCYFFLKKNDSGGYSVATPTTGFAHVQDGNVFATYRHSYHRALVPIALYESSMKPIFDRYHGLPVDTRFIEEHIARVLSLAPVRLDEEGETFFTQHVALESIYHLRLTNHYARILPFLNDTLEYHSRISAARALGVYDSEEAGGALMSVIADTAAGDFLHVIAIQALGEHRRPELKKELQKLEATASTEINGFGGSIMDPRVCTPVPTVRQALQSLIARL